MTPKTISWIKAIATLLAGIGACYLIWEHWL